MNSTQEDVSSHRKALKQSSFGASEIIHRNSLRGLAIKLPGTPYEIQMKLHYGVELLLVFLEEGGKPYCSLRYLEAALGFGDLREHMNTLGLSLKTTTLPNAGLLPDIIKLRSGIAEPEPILIEFQAASCILKQLGLGPENKEDA